MPGQDERFTCHNPLQDRSGMSNQFCRCQVHHFGNPQEYRRRMEEYFGNTKPQEQNNWNFLSFSKVEAIYDFAMDKNFVEEWKARFDQCGPQKVAADKLGKDKSTVSIWGPKSGTVPGVEIHQALADAYNVSPAWLAWGDGPKDSNAYRTGLAFASALELVPEPKRSQFLDGVMTLAGLDFAMPVSSETAPASHAEQSAAPTRQSHGESSGFAIPEVGEETVVLDSAITTGQVVDARALQGLTDVPKFQYPTSDAQTIPKGRQRGRKKGASPDARSQKKDVRRADS
jgi:hypothetical protein